MPKLSIKTTVTVRLTHQEYQIVIRALEGLIQDKHKERASELSRSLSLQLAKKHAEQIFPE